MCIHAKFYQTIPYSKNLRPFADFQIFGRNFASDKEKRNFQASLLDLAGINMCTKNCKHILSASKVMAILLPYHGRTDSQVGYRAHSQSHPYGR